MSFFRNPRFPHCPECTYGIRKHWSGSDADFTGMRHRDYHTLAHDCGLCGTGGGTRESHTNAARVPPEVVVAYRLGGYEAARELVLAMARDEEH